MKHCYLHFVIIESAELVIKRRKYDLRMIIHFWMLNGALIRPASYAASSNSRTSIWETRETPSEEESSDE